MRILIYSESETAKKQLANLREEGHKTSLRCPELFDAKDVESCDLAITDRADIIEAYQAKGIEADWLIEPQVFQSVEVSAAPKRGRKSSK